MVFPNESELIARLKKGDSRAVTQWYELSKSDLLSFFSRQVENIPDAQELVQDTFLSCLSSLPLFRGHSGLWGWMLSIARHEVADYWRKKYAKKLINALPYGHELLDSLHAGPESDHARAQRQKSQEVQELLQHLPRDIAELLQLKYVDGFSIKELAKRFSMSVPAMQSKLYRAKELFTKEYEKAISSE